VIPNALACLKTSSPRFEGDVGTMMVEDEERDGSVVRELGDMV
jgi:hypothetical protein